MKTIVLCATAIASLTLAACAQVEGVIKQRAKDLSDQNNARQGVQPAPPAAPAPTPAAVRPAPVRPSPQQMHIAKLKADIAHSHRAGAATDPFKQEFARDVLAATQSSGRPSTNTLAQLSDHLLNALGAKNVSTSADDAVVSKLVILLNSSSLSLKRTDELAAEVQTALEAAGVPPVDAARIGADLRSVAADVRATTRL